MARKKPGKSKTAKKKATKKAARTTRSAKAAKARTKTVKKKKASPAAKSRKKTTTRSTRKTKKIVKRSTGAKTKSKAASKKKTASAKSPRVAASKKTTKKTAKAAKVTKKTAKADSAKKGSKKAAPTGPVPDAQGYVVINGRRVRMISTKGLTIPKKTASAKAASAKDDADDKPKKPRKSRLTPKDLEYFRDLLLLHRRQLAGDLTSMETEALRSSGGNVSHMPIHMADIGSDTFDQDFMLGLAANERVLLKDIDEALARIESREYGICALTGNPIPKSRLNAKPWAKYTVEAARMIERGVSA